MNLRKVLIGLSLAYIGLAIVAILVPLWLITGAFRDIGIEADFDMRYSGLIWECAETDCNVIGRSRSAHAAMSFPVRLAAGVFLGCGILLSLLTAHSLSQKAYPRAFVASIVRFGFDVGVLSAFHDGRLASGAVAYGPGWGIVFMCFFISLTTSAVLAYHVRECLKEVLDNLDGDSDGSSKIPSDESGKNMPCEKEAESENGPIVESAEIGEPHSEDSGAAGGNDQDGSSRQPEQISVV